MPPGGAPMAPGDPATPPGLPPLAMPGKSGSIFNCESAEMATVRRLFVPISAITTSLASGG